VSIRGLLEGATNKQKLQKTLTGQLYCLAYHMWLHQMRFTHMLDQLRHQRLSAKISGIGFNLNPKSLATVWHSTKVSAVLFDRHSAWGLEGAKHGFSNIKQNDISARGGTVGTCCQHSGAIAVAHITSCSQMVLGVV